MLSTIWYAMKREGQDISSIDQHCHKNGTNVFGQQDLADCAHRKLPVVGIVARRRRLGKEVEYKREEVLG
jgi:hypothetical protein